MDDSLMNELFKFKDIIENNNFQADENLFEMASIKEYRHSAILGYLLNQKVHGEKIHLKSFFQRIFGEVVPRLTGDIKIECERSVKANGRTRPIDILVSSEDFALIIENKCRGAEDQENQICDYWEGVKGLNNKYTEENIYVLYLPPMNAFVQPSDSSLGTMKDRFKTGDLKKHLIVVSYYNCILPWLTEDVLPNIRYGSGRLMHSLWCYIDLLKSTFGVLSENLDGRKVACEKFKAIIKKDDFKEIYETASTYIKEFEKKTHQSEQEANKCDTLLRQLQGIKNYLQEQYPLLNPAQLSYEVYWLLRKNPTLFASHYVRDNLDAGLFFKKGKRQCAYSSVVYKERTIECWFDAELYAKYCKGEALEGSILSFGIGNAEDDNSYPEIRKEKEYTWDKPEKHWLAVRINNGNFEKTKKTSGGELLWEIATIIAKEAKKFSNIVEKELGPEAQS